MPANKNKIVETQIIKNNTPPLIIAVPEVLISTFVLFNIGYFLGKFYVESRENLESPISDFYGGYPGGFAFVGMGLMVLSVINDIFPKKITAAAEKMQNYFTEGLWNLISKCKKSDDNNGYIRLPNEREATGEMVAWQSGGLRVLEYSFTRLFSLLVAAIYGAGGSTFVTTTILTMDSEKDPESKGLFDPDIQDSIRHYLWLLVFGGLVALFLCFSRATGWKGVLTEVIERDIEANEIELSDQQAAPPQPPQPHLSSSSHPSRAVSGYVPPSLEDLQPAQSDSAKGKEGEESEEDDEIKVLPKARQGLFGSRKSTTHEGAESSTTSLFPNKK